MTRRTTGLAGTFVLLCVAHVLTAQAYSRPRIGLIVPASARGAAGSTGTNVAAPRAGFRQQPGNRTHFGAVTPQPQPRPQASGVPVSIRWTAPSQTGEQLNAQMDSRRMRRYPVQATAQPAQASRIQAAPRGRPTTIGNAPRIGLIPLTPQTVPGQFTRTVFTPVQNFGFVQVSQFFYLPAVVLTDGRIFASFNGSYEQVLRRCSAFSGTLPPNFTTSTCWMIDQYGRYLVVQPR